MQYEEDESKDFQINAKADSSVEVPINRRASELPPIKPIRNHTAQIIKQEVAESFSSESKSITNKDDEKNTVKDNETQRNVQKNQTDQAEGKSEIMNALQRKMTMQNALKKYFHQQIKKSTESQYAQKEKMKLKALSKSSTLKVM